MELVGVKSVNELAGKPIRVFHDDKKIHYLGSHLLDKWLSIEDLVIRESEQPDGITIKEDVDGKKHYGLEVDTGQIGAEIQGIGAQKN